MATQILQTISMNEQERIAYEEQLIYELDRRSELASAERRGREAGKQEAKEVVREIAKAFKQDNIPLGVIVKNTGLTLQEVEAL